jgi:hypothetical protein
MPVYYQLYIVTNILIHITLIVAWPKPELKLSCSVAGAQTTFVQCNPSILGIAEKLLSLQE